MHMPVPLRRTTLALAFLALLLPMAPASAVAPETFSFDDTFSFKNRTCGVQTQVDGHEWGSGQIRYDSDGIAYFTVKWDGHITLTRKSSGLAVDLYASFIDRDAEITQNPDGTLTIEARSIINESDYGPDGTLGLRTVGQQTVVFVVDLNGTPDNFDDDEVLDSWLVSFSGRDDREDTDFCEWYLAVTA